MRGYRDMLAELYGLRRFGVKLELERVAVAARTLGVLELGVPVVQVGGTNGKGSTCAFLESCLGAAGVRTGLFTSPHLSRFTERIRVAGAELAPELVLSLYGELRGRIDAELTFFERATLLALLAFREAQVDVVILEVGLGGRFDATTAVGADVAVVTGVAMDHQAILGGTLEAIAMEKGGIFRRGKPAVVGESGLPAGRALLEAAAIAAGARLVPVPPLPAEWTLGLVGSHQRPNAAAALAALDALESVGAPAVAPDARRHGLAAARWPARIERIQHGDVTVWLDAAHNPDGARALAAALGEVAVPACGLVVGVASDKAEAEMLAALAPVARWAIATEGPTRARPAAELAAVAAGCGIPAETEPDWRMALSSALIRASADGLPLVVAGSLFLVGAVRAWLLGEPEDPIVTQDPMGREFAGRPAHS